METKEIIKLNAALQDCLTKENEQYYGNFLVYVRILGTFRDEHQTEELLLEIIEDILEAQKQGLTAEEYFGKNPKEIADDILEQLPKMKVLTATKLLLSSYGVYLVFNLLPKLVMADKPFDIGTFFLSGIYWQFLIFFLLWIIGQSVYHYSNKDFKFLLYLLFGVGFSGGVALIAFVDTPIKVSLSGSFGIEIILVISAVLLYLFIKQQNKKLWFSFIPLVAIDALLGIISRVPYFSDYMTSPQGKNIIVIATVIGLFSLYLLSHFSLKKSPK